jgi:hypothetical protein
MEIRNIISGVVFIIILYVIYVYAFKKSHSSLISTQMVDSVITVNNPGVESSSAYSMWVYISEWNVTTNVKHVMTRMSNNKLTTMVDDDNDTSPALYSPTIYLGAVDNNLTISFEHPPPPPSANSGTPADSGNTNIENLTIPNFPIQSWTNLIVSVNTKTLDIYINGKLVRSHVLLQPLNNSVGPVYLGQYNVQQKKPYPPDESTTTTGTTINSYIGYISTFRYFSDPITPSDAWSIYNDGYDNGGVSGSSIGNYKLKLSVLNNNNEVNSLEL